MDCEDLERLLAVDPPAELSADDRAAIEAHVAECEACREAWGDACTSQELHAAVKELATPSSIKSTVLARLAGKGPEELGDEPKAPKQIAGFRVLAFIGRGGMGNVFKARQVSMDRLVALKLLPARLAANEQFVERLSREARAAARLSHPNIVHAYDVGSADGHYYFAMEYIDGEGLDAALRRDGPLEPSRACRLMMQVTSALAAAHEAGVIHRDIKPSNILIDTKGRARLADFGLAKRIEGDAATAAVGESLGTPAYAAPEVCAGREIDARADLYSLGATFFHLLAGRLPFEDPDAARVLVKQVKEAPPSLAAVAPDVDPRLCRIIDRLLRKDPAERHPSARALLDELEALGELGDQPPEQAAMQDAPTMPLRPGQKLLRQFQAQQDRGGGGIGRRRIVAIAAVAAVACLAVGLTIALWPRRPRDQGRVTFVSSAVPAEPEVDLSEHNAEVIFRRAQRAASLSQWVLACRELDLLKQEHAGSRFYAAHSVEIARLRARAVEELRPEGVTPRPEGVPEPPAPAPKLPERPSDWFALFDGKSLRGWRMAEGEQFAGHGPAHVAEGRIVIPQGPKRAAIAWTGEFPTVDYELELELRREAGTELSEILFPVGSVECGWNLAGHGGTSMGVAVIDGAADNANDTRRPMTCRTGQWYRARLRVTEARIEGWIDDEKWTDVQRAGRSFSQPWWIPVPEPLALATWRSTLAVRSIRLKLLESEPEEPPADGSEIEAAAVVVPAKGVWLDTGLHLAKGTQYEISATGRWGANTAWSDGPEGRPRGAFRGHPLLGARMYDLIGRVGGQGRPFHVGGQLQLTPGQPGRLYLRMNDNGIGDNWGSLRVSIRGPMVADKAAPLLSRFPKTVAEVHVRPGRGWTSSGIALRRGDTVVISAAGQWNAAPQRGPVDADGWNQTWGGQRAGALIGRIGHRGARFTVGSRHLLQARESGTLYLALNDMEPGDHAPRPAGQHPGALNLLKGIEWLLPRGRGQAPAKPKEPPKAPQEPAPAPPGDPEKGKAVAPGPAQAREVVGRERAQGAITATVFASDAFQTQHEEPQERHDVACRLLATLRGHTSWVISVGFSPDGKLLASGGRDRTAKIWDLPTAQCLKTLRGHLRTVESVAFSPDGKQLVSGSGDRMLRLWDVPTGRLVKVLPGHHKWVRSVAFFPDGERVASTGADETARIWELAGPPRARALPCGAACWIVAVSPDGERVAVVNERGWLRIWDADTGHDEHAFFAQMSNGWALAFSPDGQRLASAGDNPVVRVWDVATGERLATLALDGMVRSIAFSPDGRYLATADGHRAVRLWDAATYEHLRSVEDHTNEARCIAFAPDSKRFATASFDGTIKIWALEAHGRDHGKPDER